MNCWILNTKNDDNGIITPQWDYFKEENVIAIGWDVPPGNWKTKDAIALTIKSYDTERGVFYIKRAANTVFRFLKDMHQSDNIVLCAGYNSQQKEVLIFGLAEISEEEPKYDTSSRWWKIKRDAKINIVDKFVPREELAKILGKGTCRNTLTSLGCDNFLELQSYLRKKGYLKQGMR